MTEPFKIVIVEDEPISSAFLKNLISQTSFKTEVLKEIDSVSEAISYFKNNLSHDLIFMDIHLGDGTCWDILNAISVEKSIIFCTTFDTYAIQAFKYNSLDYIVKPAKNQDIENALKKYQLILKNQDNSHLERMDKMMETIAPTEYKKRFLVRSENRLKVIHIKDVVCFYSDEGDTRLIENNGSEYIIDYTMERLEKLVNPSSYFRINRKMTINIDYIHSVEDYFNNRLKIKLQKKVPFDFVVSRNRVKEFKTWLKGIS